MKRYILTGAPGAGKTAIIRGLEADGLDVVEEAATDVIALRLARGEHEPHAKPNFIDDIVELQRKRQIQAASRTCEVQFHDRSAICTYALCVYLDRPVPASLQRELERIKREGIYQQQVFFIANLGFVTPSEARRISFEDSLRFEQVHHESYRRLGYECIQIPAGPLMGRIARIRARIDADRG